MTDIYNPKSHFEQLKLPVQDLAKLTFCGSNKLARVQYWADQLQATRIAHTSVQLYKNLPEISRLKADAKTRLAMLEALRPTVQNTIGGLAKDFLGQPLILPDNAQKKAIVAQALQKGMINGYSICVRDLVHQKNLNPRSQENLVTALSRAVTGIGWLYLRNCQIYTPLPSGGWSHLHHLYRIAEHFQLLNIPVQDATLERSQTITIRNSYLRTIMVACSRPNQLSQQDLGGAYEAFEAWSDQVDILEEVDPENDNQFVINFSRDAPPIAKERFDGDESDFLLELDFSRLITDLRAHNKTMATELPAELALYLTDTWESSKDRQQHRRKVKTLVDVCVGLSEYHYHSAGERTFDRLIQQSGTATDSNFLDHAAISGFTPAERKVTPAKDDSHTPIRVSVQNISASGYCLYWQNDVPSTAIAGQLLGIRDAGQQEWHLGAVRWIRQLRGASQMGVQILALTAQPAIASLMYDMGGRSDPMRVLLLPASTFDRTPATLVAAAPFQESNKLHLVRDDNTLTVKLDKCLFGTSKLRQFTYTVVNSTIESAAENPPDEGFDSNWN